MTETRRFGLIDFLLFLAILIAAAGARTWYLTRCANSATDDGPLQVQDDWGEERDALVASLKDNKGFVGPAPLAPRDPSTRGPRQELTAHAAPLYPWLLSLLARTSPDMDAAYRTARWAQCGLGALTVGLYFLFARRAFRSLFAATLTGLLAAVYPFWIINTAERADGVVTTFLLALCLWLGVRGTQTGGALTSWFYGLALAGLAMVRAALLPFAFVAVLGYLLSCRKVPRGWLYGLLAFLGLVNGLVPWSLRNYQSFADVMPIVDSAFLHLWEGNNPRATGGPLSEETRREALASSSAEEGKDKAVTAEELGELPQKERYLKLARPLLQEVRDNPAETIKRRLHAGLDFVFGEEWFKQGKVWQGDVTDSNQNGTPAWLRNSYPAILLGALLGVLIFGALGWRFTYAYCQDTGPAALAVILIPLPYLLSHAEALQGPRLPLDGIFLSYAAFILTGLFRGARGLGSLKTAAPDSRRIGGLDR